VRPFLRLLDAFRLAKYHFPDGLGTETAINRSPLRSQNKEQSIPRLLPLNTAHPVQIDLPRALLEGITVELCRDSKI